jgi:hypothetical protein
MSSARVLRISPNRKTVPSPMRRGRRRRRVSFDEPATLDTRQANVTPNLFASFGGVVNPQSLRFPFNRLPAGDARDRDAIRQFAEQAGSLFAHSARAVRI